MKYIIFTETTTRKKTHSFDTFSEARNAIEKLKRQNKKTKYSKGANGRNLVNTESVDFSLDIE